MSAEALSRRVAKRRGRGWSSTLRRSHTLAVDGLAPAALLVQGNHAAGSPALVLGASRLVGAVPRGLRITVGGVDYWSQGAAVAAAEQISIALDRPLESPALNWSSATIAAHRDMTYDGFLMPSTDSASGGLRVRARGFVLVPPKGGNIDAPAVGDLLIGTEGVTVSQVVTVVSGGTPVRWIVSVGEASS